MHGCFWMDDKAQALNCIFVYTTSYVLLVSPCAFGLYSDEEA